MRAAERDAKVSAAVARERDKAEKRHTDFWDAVMHGSTPEIGGNAMPDAFHTALSRHQRRMGRWVARGLNRQVTCSSDRHRADWKYPVKKVQVVDRPGDKPPYWAYWCTRCIKIHRLEVMIAIQQAAKERAVA